jgi:hypothetical protein
MRSLHAEMGEYHRRVLDGMVVDPMHLPLIYELPKEADWTNESLWAQANPAQGGTIHVEALREEKAKVLALRSEQNKLRRLHLNQRGVGELGRDSISAWDACYRGSLRGPLPVVAPSGDYGRPMKHARP